MCPVGYFESEGTCKQCPLDQYNAAEQGTGCTACPEGTKTLEKGSVSIDQCISKCVLLCFIDFIKLCTVVSRGFINKMSFSMQHNLISYQVFTIIRRAVFVCPSGCCRFLYMSQTCGLNSCFLYLFHKFKFLQVLLYFDRHLIPIRLSTILDTILIYVLVF